jgi:thymidylate synthase ThyX
LQELKQEIEVLQLNLSTNRGIMEVSYVRLVDPKWIVGALQTTSGKDMYKVKDPSIELYRKLLHTAGGTVHSPIRVVMYRFYVEDVKAWVSTHYARHHVGAQPYIKAQRSIPNRDILPQGALVNMILDINANALITVAKARLCSCAAKETREVMVAIKNILAAGDQYDQALADYLKPPCDWYNTCFELKPCKEL